MASRVGATDLSLTPLVGDVLWPPVVAHGSDDQRHLVYELRLANPTPAAIDLAKVEVIDPRSGRTLLEAAPAELARRFSIGGRRGAEASALTVGQFGVLFLHVPLPAGTGVPSSIVHRVTGLLRPDRDRTSGSPQGWPPADCEEGEGPSTPKLVSR
jgi:hypothetical protein